MISNFVGSFTDDHFFAVESDGYVCSGFRVFGFEILNFGVPMMAIANVRAVAGQASSLAGTDMNDWRILVNETNDLQIIGPAQVRERAEQQVIAIRGLLHEVGWTPSAVG